MSRSPSSIVAASVALILLAGCSSTAQLGNQVDPDAADIEAVSAPETLESVDAAPVGRVPQQKAVAGAPPEAIEGPLAAAEQAFVASAPSSAAPSAPASGAVAYGPGASDQAIRIGAPVPHQSSFLNDNIYQEAERPDFTAVWRVITRAINSSGGILGRRLELTLLKDQPNAEQICTHFTEEEAVIAVVGYVGAAAECLSDAGTVSISHPYSLERNFYHGAPYALSTMGISMRRSTKLYIEGLYQQGFFEGDHKIGLIRWDIPPYPALVNEVVQPMLARYGLRIAEELVITNPDEIHDIPRAQSEGRSGVQVFKAAGIDRVLTLDSGSYILPEFTDYAEAQGYRPRYGMNSLNGGEWDMERKQLKGAMGIGWMPWLDLEPRHAYRHGSEGARRCKDLMDAAGEGKQMATYNEALWTSSICDGVLLLKAAIEAGGGNITAGSIVAGAETLGTSFSSANTVLSRYEPGRIEPVAAVRLIRWFVRCECFRYTSGLLDAG